MYVIMCVCLCGCLVEVSGGSIERDPQTWRASSRRQGYLIRAEREEASIYSGISRQAPHSQLLYYNIRLAIIISGWAT